MKDNGLKQKLNEFIYIVNNKKEVLEKDFENFWELYLDSNIETRERTLCIKELSEAFWSLCINWNGHFCAESAKRQIESIKQLVSFISAISNDDRDEFYKGKEIVFLEFLKWLDDRERAYVLAKKDRFFDFYRKLNDVIAQVKWIFELQIGEKKVFPIHRLLEDVATDFKLTEEHYLQLVFSLQLFNKVKILGDNEDAIKKEMLKIADEYHIDLIKMLCEGGEILYDKNAGINCAKNGTIVALHNNIVLIRNVDESYFDDGCEYEGVSRDKAIAFYYKYEKQSDEVACTIYEFFDKSTNEGKQQAIVELMEKKIYNVFLGKVFWINGNTNKFTRVINDYSCHDDFLVENGNVISSERKLFETFWKRIKNDERGLRLTTIAESRNVNILTLDFIAELSCELCDEDSNCYKQLLHLNNEEYFQNQMIKAYLDEKLESDKIFEAIRKYGKFINDHFNIDIISANTDLMEFPHLIMPYKIFVPFEGSSKVFAQKLVQQNYLEEEVQLEELFVNKKIGNVFEVKVHDNVISKDKIFNLAGMNVELKKIGTELCLYSSTTENVYVFDEYKDVLESINKIKEISTQFVITDEWMNEMSKATDLITIICNIGFESIVYKIMGSTYRNKGVNNIALYKMLWMIQVYEFDIQKYKQFENLILNDFYCNLALNTENMVNRYIKELDVYNNKKSLIIAKESDGEGATLNLLLERYSNGDRGALRAAFDGDYINRKISKPYNEYLYMGQKIDTIIFLTDNALSGKSTIEMLLFYLENIKENDNPRTYIFDESHNQIPQIYSSNKDIKIIVKTLFYSERAKSKINKKLSKYNIEIEGEMLPKDKYCWSKEVNNKIENLFGSATEPRIDNVQCILRPCNLPYDKILPDQLKDTKKLIGIFMRKSENG